MRHTMKLSISLLLLALTAVSLPVLSEDVQRSSHPQGVQINGNADLRAQQESTAAVAVGEGNVARNSASAVRSNVQIQGNTKITAEQKNARAIAVGNRSAAENEVGVIGGK